MWWPFRRKAQLDRIEAAVGAVWSQLVRLNQRENAMSQQLQQLADAVTKNANAVNSAVQLIGGLAAQIEALKEDPAALSQLAADLNSQADALAAAVVANTPAEEPTE